MNINLLSARITVRSKEVEYHQLKELFGDRVTTTTRRDSINTDYHFVYLSDQELALAKLTIDLSRWKVNDPAAKEFIQSSRHLLSTEVTIGYSEHTDYKTLRKLFGCRLERKLSPTISTFDCSYVYVYLTDEELALVKLAIDMSNWKINDPVTKYRIENNNE